MTALEGEILGPDAEPDKKDEKTVRRKFWATLAKAADQIPFTEDLVAAYYCAFDTKTPMRVRATLVGALAYFVFPFDALPDFLALVGFSDDVAVLTVVISTISGHMTEAHRLAARKAIDRMKFGAAPQKDA